MHWLRVHQAHPGARRLADRHYSRKAAGTGRIMPPGRSLILVTVAHDAVWGVSWPVYALSDWSRDAWVCTIFRNEGGILSSILVREAVAVMRFVWGEPPANGCVTFVDPGRTRRKRDPGRCFRRAGFAVAGETATGLIVLRLSGEAMPEPCAPHSLTMPLGIVA
jgi:hypothetical protein